MNANANADNADVFRDDESAFSYPELTAEPIFIIYLYINLSIYEDKY